MTDSVFDIELHDEDQQQESDDDVQIEIDQVSFISII